MTEDFLLLAAIGFLAQLVDGALGMAFGVISTTAMLSLGIAPAQASAIVHTAEVFTTAASAASHIYYRNVDWRLVARLGISGVLGAMLGAWLVSSIDAKVVRPFVSAYLLALGIFILYKAIKGVRERRDASLTYAPSLGLAGGFLDASGGGGWGPFVTSTLIGTGHAPRTVVGSTIATEFFVSAAATATFIVALDDWSLGHAIALVLGGLIAAPFGGIIAKHVPARPLMTAVGGLVILLTSWQLIRFFGWF